MTAQRRRALGLVGGLLAVVLAALAFSARGDDGDDRLAVRGVAENAPSTTTSAVPEADGGPSTTLPLVPVTTGVPVPDAFEPPPSTAPPTATPGAPRPAATTGGDAGTVVTGQGAVLTRSPSGATRKVDKAKGCTSATADGWKIEDCGALRTSGTVLLWLVEAKGRASRALVLKEQTSGTWTVVLSAADVDGTAFDRIGVRGEDVSGDGQPELVFGFHRKDAARTLSMDVVDAAPAVVVHRDLAGGRVRLAKGEITTWAAAADGTPGAYDQVAIRFVDGAWRAGAAQRVDRQAVGDSMI
ncbi:MAG TPA: hypothetical protein VM933_05210 [Acidimicrobiales bacterium]|nr:hypothetical protein [Acidimicrobiales bacterium]